MLLKFFFAIKSFNRHFDESVALLFRRRRKTTTLSSQTSSLSSQETSRRGSFRKTISNEKLKLYMIIIIIISLTIGWTYPWRVVTPLPWTGTISICVAGFLFFPNYTSAVSNGKKANIRQLSLAVRWSGGLLTLVLSIWCRYHYYYAAWTFKRHHFKSLSGIQGSSPDTKGEWFLD